MLSSAATVLFQQLQDFGRDSITVSELSESPQYGYTESAKADAVGPRFVRITDIKGGKVNWETVPYCVCENPAQYLIRAGDILVARAGSVGKSFLVSDVPEPAVFASYMIRLRAKDKTLPSYIYWFFQSRQFWLQVADASRGSAMGNINGKMLAGLTLPNATPSEQQVISDFLGVLQERFAGKSVDLLELKPPFQNVRRIVARIEALAAKIEEARGLRQKAVEETTAMLNAARNFAIGEKPNKDWLPLRTFVAQIFNGKSPDCEKRPATPGEWGVLKVGAVSFGVFDENENKALPPYMQPNPEYEVNSGDFLMIRANTKELVGACAIVGKTRHKLLLSDKTFRFVFREDKPIDKNFLNHVLKSPALRTQIEQQASGTSPTMKNISKEKVMELLIPPFSEDEQRRLVAYLDGLQAQVSALRELQSESARELAALLPSVLDRAFKGEL